MVAAQRRNGDQIGERRNSAIFPEFPFHATLGEAISPFVCRPDALFLARVATARRKRITGQRGKYRQRRRPVSRRGQTISFNDLSARTRIFLCAGLAGRS